MDAETNIEKTAKETITALMIASGRHSVVGDGAEAMRYTQAALNAANALVALKVNNLLPH